MVVAVVRVPLLNSLRFLVAVFLLSLPWTRAIRCFGQEPPRLTEEQSRAREKLNGGSAKLQERSVRRSRTRLPSCEATRPQTPQRAFVSCDDLIDRVKDIKQKRSETSSQP